LKGLIGESGERMFGNRVLWEMFGTKVEKNGTRMGIIA
jgi:hypothetical protein